MFESILWVVFIALCLLVSAVILLQEGKGGGLGEAFGGAGAQTFGHKADGIAKFTGWVAVGIVVLAIVITKLRSGGSVLDESVFAPEQQPFADPTGVSAPVNDLPPADPNAPPTKPK
jgi:preprotein translocase subunit SecG